MIPVARPKEPETFDARVRVRGHQWLDKNPDAKRPHDYWSEFRDQLMVAFHHRCGYSALFDQNGTVDHFESCQRSPRLAYEWQNLRYATGWINSSKQDKEHTSFLDPFDVEEGWFQVLLPSFELVVDPERVPAHLLERARETLATLPIGRHPRILKARRYWYERYKAGKLTLEQLREFAPQVAAAVEKDAKEC